MYEIEKLSDELLSTVSGGTIKEDAPKGVPVSTCVKIGLCGGILGFAAGAQIAKKYAVKKKMRFNKKIKTIFLGAVLGAVTGGTALSAGAIVSKKTYDFIKEK